ncbi:hypothetical protein J6590_020130 [Homalodisca vitripennis]|nr:hypothetical protein J6590_020130 [Homalodisca vitripennis]
MIRFCGPASPVVIRFEPEMNWNGYRGQWVKPKVQSDSGLGSGLVSLWGMSKRRVIVAPTECTEMLGNRPLEAIVVAMAGAGQLISILGAVTCPKQW